jgi:hypothetical protein
VLFRRGHLAAVLGLQLADGRRVVVKLRPPAARIRGCVAVQRHLHSAGFPCPQHLAGPQPLGDQVATAEGWMPGEPIAIDGAAIHASAAALAELIAKAPPPAAVASLAPAPPWVRWEQDEAGTWPPPDDLDLDLNDRAGPPLVDEVGAKARSRLLQARGEPVCAHVDWEGHNMLWQNGRLSAVLDWDSVAALPEPAVVGAAAAVFPSTPDATVVAASPEQADAFLHAYLAARGSRWSDGDWQVAWAAGLWLLAFNAKKESRGGGRGYLPRLEEHAAARGYRTSR